MARLQLVVGKGGVGKSTVCAALALGYARRGKRVLALELGRGGGLARQLGVPDCEEPREAAPGVYTAFVEGESALAEYLELVLPVRRLFHAVLESRIYRSFVGAAPGLKELMAVGKVWYEFEKKGPGRDPLWDLVVVDAGAAGHSLRYLSMPSTAAETFKSGLVHRESKRVDALLRDIAKTRVHVVAVPEDMPLTEAGEIIASLRGELRLPLGELIINRCRSAPPEGIEEAVASVAAAVGPAGPGSDRGELVRGVCDSARRELSWYRIQERGILALERLSGIGALRLPLLGSEEFGHAELEQLAKVLVRTGGEVPA